MNRLDFQKLAEVRLRDAEALFAAGRFDGAYYLAGYVIECALKACIAKKTREHDRHVAGCFGFGTWSSEMLIQLLVKEQIEGGRAVLDTLSGADFPVEGAFWCRLPDRDY